MSLAKQNLYAFIYLLNHKPLLLSEVDRENLEKTIAPLEDEPNRLSDEIIIWCRRNKENPKILRELSQTRKSLFPRSTQERAPGTKEGKIPTPDYKTNKKTLQNAIRSSSPPNNPPKNT